MLRHAIQHEFLSNQEINSFKINKMEYLIIVQHLHYAKLLNFLIERSFQEILSNIDGIL